MYQNRSRVLWLNTELFLLHGFAHIPQSIGMECLLLPTKWMTRSQRDKRHNFISISQLAFERNAGKLLWIIPPKEEINQSLSPLLDQFCVEAGLRGALYLSAAVAADSFLIDLFKAHGFSPIDWEQAWEFRCTSKIYDNTGLSWKRTSTADIPEITKIQIKTLSPAQRSILPSARVRPPQFSLLVNGKLSGFTYIKKHLDTIIATPMFTETVLFPANAINLLFLLHFSNYVHRYVIQKFNQIRGDSNLLEHYNSVQGKHVKMVKHLAVRNVMKEAVTNQMRDSRNTDILTTLHKSIDIKDKI